MRRYLFALAIIFAGCNAKVETKVDRAAEEQAIRDVLTRQETAWNQGNIDVFMDGYWKSDSLMFVGTGITQGWNATIARYKKSYPDLDAMGQLTFTFFDFNFLHDDTCLVTGKYQLKRKADEPTGMFSLVLRKINGEWVIVYDHTS